MSTDRGPSFIAYLPEEPAADVDEASLGALKVFWLTPAPLNARLRSCGMCMGTTPAMVAGCLVGPGGGGLPQLASEQDVAAAVGPVLLQSERGTLCCTSPAETAHAKWLPY